MNPSENQFPNAVPSLVDILNSGKEPKPTTKGIPTLKEMLDEDK
jgi:hypothetical protein